MWKWLKKCVPNHKTIEKSSQLRSLKSLNQPSLWQTNCQTMARGVAIGLFAAMIPGAQMLIAALLSILLRGNLPVALALTWISNPFTLVPLTYSIFYVGRLILGEKENGMTIQAFQWDLSSWHAFWSALSTWLLQFSKAFLVGLPVVSVLLAMLGYLITILIWKGVERIKHKKKC